MSNKSKTVVFFGSGPVAAESLERLTKNFTVEAVVSKPRPAHHRGSFPVLDVAAKLKLPVHLASSKAELSHIISSQSFSSQLGILIDFGIIVGQDVIDYFPLGIINSHFSILPEWRGADPISFAILSGQSETGVSLMLLVAAMDEGPLLAYGEQPLDGTETTPVLTERLISLSDALLRDQLPRYFDGATTVPQSLTGRQVSYSRKLTKEDGVLDWQKPAAQLEREIRAFIDWPKSRTTLAHKDVVITKAHVVPLTGSPGTLTVQDKTIVVACGQQALALDCLKPAGRPEMTGQAFLAGYRQLLHL